MIFIKVHPDLAKNSDPVINPELMLQAEAVAASMDDFIRKCLAKAYSPASLDLFVSMKEGLPGIDLEVTFLTASKRRLRVLFRNQELGAAISETFAKIEKGETTKITLSHKITIEHL